VLPVLISLKHEFVFFCTPKCASNSIEAMLKPHAEIHLLGSPGVRHTDVSTFEQHLLPYLHKVAPETKPTRVAVVREPVDWLYSWYRFRSRAALRGGASQNSTAGMSFAEFIDAYLLEAQRPPFAEVGDQAEFLTDAHGNVAVDVLVPYDRLDALVSWFAGRVDEPLSLGQLNVSPSRVYDNAVLEKAMSIIRGARSRLGKSSSAKSRTRSDPNALLSATQPEALRERVQRDFEIYDQAVVTTMDSGAPG